MLGAVVLPNRDDIVRLLPTGKTIAEIGVALGYFTMYAIDKAKPREFIAIDSFRLHELDTFWGKKPSDYFGDLSHADWYRHVFAGHIKSGRMRVIEGLSHEALATLADKSVDIAYVDADHGYHAVKRDLHALLPKLTDDAYIIADDYTLVDALHARDPLGVIYATNEFMIEHGWALHYLALQPHGYYQVVLRRASLPRPAEHSIHLKQKINDLEQEIAILRHSTSWRITSPLRKLGRLFHHALAANT